VIKGVRKELEDDDALIKKFGTSGAAAFKKIEQGVQANSEA